MIPKITQKAPNIMEQYWCGNCGAYLPHPHPIGEKRQIVQWKFCPHCGETIEYDLAEPVQWSEQNCEQCGRSLIRKEQSGPNPYFRASFEYIGAKICSSCMEKHCIKTECTQCKIGQQPDCPYEDIKKRALQRSKYAE